MGSIIVEFFCSADCRGDFFQFCLLMGWWRSWEGGVVEGVRGIVYFMLVDFGVLLCHSEGASPAQY